MNVYALENQWNSSVYVGWLEKVGYLLLIYRVSKLLKNKHFFSRVFNCKFSHIRFLCCLGIQQTSFTYIFYLNFVHNIEGHVLQFKWCWIWKIFIEFEIK